MSIEPPRTIDPAEFLASDEEHGLVHEHVHETNFWSMTIVFIVLVVLTVFTVLTAKYIDLPGNGNLLLAIVIASSKAILVAAFFMHLKYDKPLNTIVVVATMFAVILFLGLTMLDINSRHLIDVKESGEIITGGSDLIVTKAREKAHAIKAHGDDPHPVDAAGHEEHADGYGPKTTPEAEEQAEQLQDVEVEHEAGLREEAVEEEQEPH